ncbi:hypothetical protein ACIGO8_28960 [Streptomyces sp. NPDC053493]|uniref:hypothetical protein n=1 Tax=Streptomyces sp. NPDC053493 TaxID=3365705 RepID=UPI0037D8BCDC
MREHPYASLTDMPLLEQGLRGLEETPRANGNLVPRHLGIPTVTVPVGTMTDTGMPVGLTFAGRSYDDNALLSLAAAFEKTGSRRTEPPRTPRLPAE